MSFHLRIPPTWLLSTKSKLIDLPLFKLSYPESTTAPDFFGSKQHYGKGWDDVTFVFYWAVVLFLARTVFMMGVFAPFMRWWLVRDYEARRMARRAKLKGHGKPGRVKQPVLNGAGASTALVGVGGRKSLRSRGTATAMRDGSPVPPSSFYSFSAARQKRWEKKVTRFAEQGWSVVYYTLSWGFGWYIHLNSPWYPFQLDHLWLGYPQRHHPIPGPVKFYYLAQLASWLTQVVTINMEERRKDYLQMMTHHFITTTLMVLSYWMDYTRVGCVILFLLDMCDILLPLAKMFKYMSLEPLPDIIFCIFLLGWLITRSILYPLVVKSVIFDVPRIIHVKSPADPDAQISKGMYLTFCTLLSSLGVLLFIWLVMIGRIAWAVVSGKPAEDTRSDDEDEEDDDGDSDE